MPFKLPRWFVVLSFIVCLPSIALADTAKPAIPLHVLDRPEVTVNLLAAPCTDPVSLDLAMRGLPPETHKDLQGLSSNWLLKDGTRQDFAGCWLDVGGGFLVIFSDRTYDIIAKDEFKKTKGAVGI